MINSVVLVSGEQQDDSVTHLHVSILFQILPPFSCYRINTKQSFLLLYSRSSLIICSK